MQWLNGKTLSILYANICKVHIRLDKFHDFFNQNKKVCTLCSCLTSNRKDVMNKRVLVFLFIFSNEKSHIRAIYQSLTSPMVRLSTKIDMLSIFGILHLHKASLVIFGLLIFFYTQRLYTLTWELWVKIAWSLWAICQWLLN